MATPWLRPGKFDPPPAPAVLVARPLEPAPVTLLVAGPGYGKSTALAAAAPTVWVGLDEGDADVGTFFHALVAGVRTRIPGFGEDVLALAAGAEPRRVWAAFFAAVAAYHLPGFTLALDDLHHAYAAPGLMEGLAAAFERLPCRLLLATRQRFPVGLARLRAGGTVRLLDQAALRFTPEEARLLVPEPPGGLDGWPLGLALAAAGVGSLDEAAEELLAGQPPERRAFLARAALLDEVTAEACRRIFADEDAPAHLAALEAEQLVAPVAGGTAYRLPGFLREALLRTVPAATRAGWHRAAAAHYLGLELPEAALPHLLAGEAWAEALAACGRCFPAMRHAGRHGAIARWLAAFPPAVARMEPAHALWRGVLAARGGDALEARADLEAALAGFEARGEMAWAFKARVQLAAIAQVQDDPAAGPAIMAALARQVEGLPEDVVDLHLLRSIAADRRGDLALVAECNQAILAVPAGDNVELAATHCLAWHNLFAHALHHGDLVGARAAIERAYQLAAERRFWPYEVGAGFKRAYLDLLDGDVDAVGAFVAGLPGAWRDGLDWFDRACADVVLGHWQLEKGEWKEAEGALARASLAFERAGYQEAVKIPLVHALWLAVARGQPQRTGALLARVFGETERPWAPDAAPNVHDLALALPHARGLALAGQPAAALDVLGDALPALAGAGAVLHLAHGRLIEAAAWLAAGDRGRAAVALAAADDLIDRHGLACLRRRDRALWAELRGLKPEAGHVDVAGEGGGLEVRLFGALDVRVEGVRLDRWSRKKAAAILACLVLRPRGLGLDAMAEWLAEGDTPGAMKIALAGLRKALEPLPGPRREGERYVLEGVTSDVQAFEAALRQGDAARRRDPAAAAAAYEQAVALYRGDLLADGFLAKHFHAERGEYREQVLAALKWLAEHRAAQHDLDGAEAALARRAAIAPTDDDACLDLVAHLVAHGRTERARQAYWDFRKALQAAPDQAFETRYRELVGLAQA